MHMVYIGWSSTKQLKFIGESDLLLSSNFSARRVLCGCVSAGRYICTNLHTGAMQTICNVDREIRDALCASQLT